MSSSDPLSPASSSLPSHGPRSGPAQPREMRQPSSGFSLRRPSLVGALPPVIFLPILGLVALAQALAMAAWRLGFGMEMADLFRGMVAALWALAMGLLLVKLVRRPSVLLEDLRPLPGRAGLASATLGGMAVSVTLAPIWPGLALGLVLVSLALHQGLVALLFWRMQREGAAGQVPDPTWHLTFSGMLMAVPVLRLLEWNAVAAGILWLGLVTALSVWMLALAQMMRARPPAVLRPLLALHLVPATLIALTGLMLGMGGLARGFMVIAVLIFVALVLRLRWLTEAGFTPLWGALSFPLAMLSQALMTHGALATGLAVLGLALVANLWIAFAVLRLVPGGRLAQRTNAAEV